MKKILIAGSIAALFSIGISAQAQQQDSTSSDYNSQDRVERAADDAEEGVEEAGSEVRQGAENAADDVEQGAENAGSEVRQGAEEVGNDVQEGAQNASDKVSDTADKAGNELSKDADKAENAAQGAVQSADQDLEQATNQMEDAWKDSVVDAYVGPNGEKVFKEGRKFYYMNAEGEKVRIKKKDLKENPDMK